MKPNKNNITKTSRIENYDDNEITLKPESTTNTVIIPKLKLDPSGNTLTLDRTKLNTTQLNLTKFSLVLRQQQGLTQVQPLNLTKYSIVLRLQKVLTQLKPLMRAPRISQNLIQD